MKATNLVAHPNLWSSTKKRKDSPFFRFVKILFRVNESMSSYACEHHPTCEHGSFSFTCPVLFDDVDVVDVVGYDGMTCLIPYHVH